MIMVRLTHLPDGKPVSGATLSQTRFDMGPEVWQGWRHQPTRRQLPRRASLR